MAAQQTDSAERRTHGRLRRVAGGVGQGLGAALACALWLGLASPGLHLLPGVSGLADENIEISLQSAMLGIDDGSGRPSAESARAAAGVLGLTFGQELLTTPAGGSGEPGSGLVRLGAVATQLAAGGPPGPDEGSQPTVGESAPVPVADTPAPPADERAPVADSPAEAVPSPAPRGAAPPAETETKPEPESEPEPAPALRAQAVVFDTSPPAQAAVGGSYSVAASASSGLPVKLSTSESRGACKLSGATLSFRSTGTCVVAAKQSGNHRYRAAEARQEFAIGRASQTVTFASAPPAPAFAGSTYAAVATADSGLAIQLAARGACALDEGQVALKRAGTCTVEAVQPGDERFLPARAEQSFVVLAAVFVEPVAPLAAQTIAFTSSVPAGATAGGTPYAVSAVASSGFPVSFSLAPASAGVCSLSGSTVSFVGAGTCAIRADQAGGAAFLAAPQVVQSFTVAKAAQSVAFTSVAPSSATVGGASYVVTATSTSGLAVSFSVAGASAGVCSLAGSTVTFVGAGTCAIRADQPGNAAFDAAPQAQQSFTVAKAAQSISFTSTAPGSAAIGGPGYVVTASATSGLAVSFSIAPASAGVCWLSGSTVSFVGGGTCTILADQPGDATYEAAPQAQQSFAVAKAAQSVAFTSTAPSSATVGGASYLVMASATSGLAVSFSVAGASAGVCTLAGSTVSFAAAGTCTILADQPGDATYDAAPQAQQSFTVAKAAQSVAFTSATPSSAAVGGASYVVTASATSGLPVSFSVAGASAGVCSLAGSTVSFAAAGTCTILADQPGDATYDAAPQAQQSFTIAKAQQSIVFTSTPPVVDEDVFFYNVSATASSGLAVAFSLTPGSAGVCALFGAWIFFAGDGTCVVLANQAGDAAYDAAPQVQQSIVVTGHDGDDD